MSAFDEQDPTATEGNGRSHPRVSRPEPRRDRPIRYWWNLFRFADGNGAAAGDGEAPDKTLSNVVDRSVKLGYEVIEEQMRQGQRTAEEINNRSYGTQAMNRDMQELMVRSMRYYVDAATIFMDALGSLPSTVAAATRPLRNPWAQEKGADSGAPPAGGGPNGGGAAKADSPGPASAAIPVRVASVRPATVTLDLHAGAAGAQLAVPALYAAGAGKPPLTGLAFEAADAGLVLRVEVPPEQPAGLYSGVVFDAASDEPRGTVTVRID